MKAITKGKFSTITKKNLKDKSLTPHELGYSPIEMKYAMQKKGNISRLSHDRMKIQAGYNFGLI